MKNGKQIVKFFAGSVLLSLVVFGGLLVSRKTGPVALNVGTKQILAQAGGLLTSGLVAHWPFDGNAVDAVGSNDGTPTGGPIYAAGKFGNAVQFDGADDLIRLENTAVSTYPNFTLSLWFKSASTNTNKKLFAERETTNPPDYKLMEIVYNDNDPASDLNFWYRDENQSESACRTALNCQESSFDLSASDPKRVSNDQWHHVAALRAGTVWKIYYDGVLKSTKTLSMTNISPTTSCFGAACNLTPSNFYTGLIDEVRVYNRALNDAEVSALYTGIPPTPATPSAVASATCGGKISLSWTAVANTAGYKLYRDGGSTNLLTADYTPLTFNDTVSAGTSHTYRLVAANPAGDSAQSVATASTLSSVLCTPSAPSAVTGVCGGHVAVSWTASSGADSYKLYRDGDPTNILPVSYSGLTFSDTVGFSTSHTYTVSASNASGDSLTSAASAAAIASAVCMVDTTPPTVSVTTPTSGSTVSGSSVTVTASASDNVGVAGVQFKLDGVNLQSEDTSSPFSITWNTLTTNSGSHTLTAVARDAAGNTSTSGGVSVTESSNPAGSSARWKFDEGSGVNVSDSHSGDDDDDDSPAHPGVRARYGQSSGGPSWLSSLQSKIGSSALSFNGVDDFVISGSSYSFGASSYALSAWIKTTDAGISRRQIVHSASGPNNYYFLALNNNNLECGDSKEGIGETFIRPLNDNAWHHVACVRNKQNTYSWHIDGVVVKTVPITGTNDHVFEYFVDMGADYLSNSEYFRGDIDDVRIHNRSLSAAEVTAIYYEGDTMRPTISLTTPTSGSTVSGSSVTVTASASDNVGVAGVQFKLDGVNLQSEDTSSPFSITWNTLTTNSGSHTLTAVARDAAGNLKTSSGRAVTVSNIDATLPTISITAPTAGSSLTHEITVSANASDNVGVAGVQFKLDGVNLKSEDTLAPYSIEWDPTLASAGSHTLTAIARDASGNTTTSASVSVTVGEVVLSGLVNRWKFNNDAVDSVGGVNGTLVNGATFGTGIMGGALSLDGINDYVSLPGRPIENLSDETKFTISAWYYLESSSMGADTNGLKIFREAQTTQNASHVELGVNRSVAGVPGSVSFFDQTSPDVDGIAVGPKSSPLGRWHLVVATRSGTTLTLYRDGVSAGTWNDGSAQAPNTNIACIGAMCLTASQTNHFDGLIDDLRVYNRALTAGEVTTLYGQSAPNSYPTVSISTPLSGAIFGTSDTISISASASDTDGSISKVEFFDGGNKIGEALTAPYTFDWTGFSPGTHILTTRVTDNDGKVSSSQPVSVTVNDTTMPDVSILEPLNSSTVSGVTPIVADASDNVDVVGVRFKLDGANLQAEVTSEPYSISWDPTTTTSGPHTLTAVARDAAGNSIASASVAVIVPDITNPTVSITSPDEGSTSGIISVRAVASDNATVAGVQFKLDGLNLLLEDTVAPYSITWDTNTASVGSHILTAVAKDSSGNTTTSLPVAINLINAGFGSVQAVLIDSTYGVMPSTNWTIDTGTSNSSGDTLSSVSAVRHTVHVTKLPGFSVLVDWCTYTGSECTLSADAGYSASDLGLGCFGTDCTLQVTVPINQTIKLAFKYVPLQAALARCALGYHMRTLIAANIYSTPSASGVPIGTQASNKHTLIQADPAVGAPTVPYLADGLWWCYGNFDDAVDGWVVDSYLIRSVAPRYESL